MRANEILTELTGIKKHTSQIGPADLSAPYTTSFDQYPDIANQSVQYRDILEQQGYKEIGVGGSGTVWQHPSRPNEVLKVFMSSDRGYDNWIKICLVNRGNPNLPRFLSANARKVTRDFKAVRTEILGPVSGDADGIAYQIGVLVKNCSWGNAVQGPAKPSASIQDMKDYIESAAPDHNGYERFDLIKDYLVKDPNFLKVLWILTTAVREKKGVPDLQGANLMQRGSTLVLTDPLS
jgi:hypothetical protein